MIDGAGGLGEEAQAFGGEGRSEAIAASLQAALDAEEDPLARLLAQASLALGGSDLAAAHGAIAAQRRGEGEVFGRVARERRGRIA
ncbi:hypothetical protein OV079_05080 [Nannocystis pusilla]|uniref:Uncharacterized protein n=1 Tax=Nannocystis pusilla TaxID=889268 RepID=A0A9X3ET19_9BACT|nr:hypothetical protein [Nannocystis pusilla]MCY1004953.1 hypothetical protein [Nannocystis pusilla]